MNLIKKWGRALDKIVRAVDTLSVQRQVTSPMPHTVAASRARKILERIRHGEYEFSDAEISEILKKNNWLGCHQSWFESLQASGDSLVEVCLQVPLLGKVAVHFLIVDLWHDQRVSSIDFQICRLLVRKCNNGYFQRLMEIAMIQLLYATLRW